MFANEKRERLCREGKVMKGKRKRRGTEKKYIKNEMKRDEKEHSRMVAKMGHDRFPFFFPGVVRGSWLHSHKPSKTTEGVE